MTDIVTHYRAITGKAGVYAPASRGRLRLYGRDTVEFLQALVSADLSGLVPGERRYSTYLTPQGRMLADLAVVHRGDHLLLDVPRERATALAERLDGLIFTEDVQVSDVSESVSQWTVIGPEANAIATAVSESVASDITVVATDESPLGAASVFAPAAVAAQVSAALASHGAIHMDDGLAEVFRIDAGRPRFGVDMNEDTIPLEAGLLDRAISTSKGCYVGQEIIIRVLHRGGGRVARRLMKIMSDAPIDWIPRPGAALLSGDRAVGQLTSAARHPESGRVIALGYVARDFASEGAVVIRDDGGGEIRAQITGAAG